MTQEIAFLLVSVACAPFVGVFAAAALSPSEKPEGYILENTLAGTVFAAPMILSWLAVQGVI